MVQSEEYTPLKLPDQKSLILVKEREKEQNDLLILSISKTFPQTALTLQSYQLKLFGAST